MKFFEIPAEGINDFLTVEFFTFLSSNGRLSMSLINGFSSAGNTFFRIIFSIIKGTEIIKLGLTVENASAMIFGDGVLVRKNT